MFDTNKRGNWDGKGYMGLRLHQENEVLYYWLQIQAGDATSPFKVYSYSSNCNEVELQ